MHSCTHACLCCFKSGRRLFFAPPLHTLAAVGGRERESERERERGEREREREREGKRGINKMSYDDAAVFLLQIESNAEPSCNAAKIINRKSKRKKTS
mmetsp:Transcript_30616/g.60194  ORF Transcript_30616/g.60194 Transcript_30616/m.60194 type:complete len:98 (+) Transcript_30616:848-1141(+)